MFEAQGLGAFGGFLRAGAAEGGDAFGDPQGGGPALGVFEQGEGAEAGALRPFPLQRRVEGGGNRLCGLTVWTVTERWGGRATSWRRR